MKHVLGQLWLRLLTWFLAPAIILTVFILLMYVLSKYKCPVRSLLGYPDVKLHPRHPPFRGAWEHNCDVSPEKK